VFGRLLAALAPTLIIVAASVLFIPRAAVILLVVGLTLAFFVSVFTRYRIHALIGGLAVAFPLAVIAVIVFDRACDEGQRFCN
jgi:hypothetical protein